jgi:hypothetical protein
MIAVTVVDELVLKSSVYSEAHLGAEIRTFTVCRIGNSSAEYETVTSHYDYFHTVPGVRSARLR